MLGLNRRNRKAPKRKLTSSYSQQAGRTLGEQETRYVGAPITIDIPSADLGTFLRIIADSMHLNLIMDQDVQGTTISNLQIRRRPSTRHDFEERGL